MMHTRPLKLTEHFKRRWRQRVGSDPTPQAVCAVLHHAVLVQPCMNLFKPNGRLYRVYAIYWHPGRDLILKIDEGNNAAVAVLSRANWRGAIPCNTNEH